MNRMLTISVTILLCLSFLEVLSAEPNPEISLVAADSHSFTIHWDATPGVSYLVLVDENTSFLFNPKVYRVKGGSVQIPVVAPDTYVGQIWREDNRVSLLGKDGYFTVQRSDFASANSRPLVVAKLSDGDRRRPTRVTSLPAPVDLTSPVETRTDNPAPTPEPQLAVLDLVHAPLGNRETLKVVLKVGLPDLSRSAPRDAKVLVRPFLGGEALRGASLGDAVSFGKAYSLPVEFWGRNGQLPLETFNENTVFDLMVLVDENGNFSPDPGEYQSRLVGLTLATIARASAPTPTPNVASKPAPAPGPAPAVAVGPRVHLVLRTQTQGSVTVDNGGEYFFGTFSAGQVFEGNYLEVTNEGDAPLILTPQKNGRYLGVTGDDLLRSYNYGDDGKGPIQGLRSYLGLSLGTMDSKPVAHHRAQATLLSNDPATPALKFTILFDIANPGPTLEVNQSREHFGKALALTWSAVMGAQEYELVRQLPGRTGAYEVVYKGPDLFYEDLDLDTVGTDQQVHYHVRAFVGKDNPTAWSWEKWASFPDSDRLDVYEFLEGRESDGTAESANHIGLGEKQVHSLYPLEDNDWLFFEAKKGVTYLVRITPVEDQITLKFHLEAGQTPQALNGPYYEATVKKPVLLKWKAQKDGRAWVRLRGRAGMASASPQYTVLVTGEN